MSKASIDLALAAFQSSLTKSGWLCFVFRLPSRCLRQYPCAARGKMLVTASTSPFWRSERIVRMLTVFRSEGNCFNTLHNFWRNQCQLSSHSTSTIPNAKGNSWPWASVAVAASKIPLYFDFRWVPSIPIRGLQFSNPSIDARKHKKRRRNWFVRVASY